MQELLTGMKRTNYCGEVNQDFIGKTVTVMGWINKRRDLGKLIFITLRDRSGILQVIIDGNRVDAELFAKAESLRGEYVIGVTGVVIPRTEKDINPNMKTGMVELEVQELRLFSQAQVPPFQVADTGVANDLRLKYRYLDLRRPELLENLILRHKLTNSARQFLFDEGFIDVETPMLTKSTPEGARDYLVPSRIYPGSFYALPQSPQIFKQLLMVAGLDRYFQIVKCFRDEDLRADRQPEFTQIDMELSFVDVDDIIDVNERMLKRIFKDVMGMELQIPFQRLSYKEAMERFGSDKPDTRFGMELVNISNIVAGSDFKVFQDAIDNSGSVRGICVDGCASLPRKQIDALVELAKTYKAKGLAWISVLANGELKTTLSKFFSPEKLSEIVSAFSAKEGDLILICADKNNIVFDALGALRLEMSKKLDLSGKYNFLWVTEFPLLEWIEDDNRFYAKHHPFTAPMDEDIHLLGTKPADVRAKAYDIVLNGVEIGGGSIRIYQRDLQQQMFEILGFSAEDAHERFGFMMDAFQYGAPPHGGLAYGLDRIVMLMTGAESIRDVIAFPKVKDASCPMTDAPGSVDEKQLEELGIKIIQVEKPNQ